MIAATPNFDRVARMYRWAEFLFHGSRLQRVRICWLPEIEHCRQVLVLGDGDGRFLARFMARNHDAQVLAVDSSAAMLSLLRRRCLAVDPTAALRLRTVHASVLDVAVPPETDLVVSHFFLDCLSDDDVRRLAGKLAATLRVGTRWVVSDFRVPASRWMRWPVRVYIRALYAAFQVLTGLRVSRLPAIGDALEGAGFVRVARREFAAGMLYSEVWQLDVPRPSGCPTAFLNEVRTQNTKNAMNSADPTNRPMPNDAQSNPEPPVPSLPEPDPGVFHHSPAGSRLAEEEAKLGSAPSTATGEKARA